MSKDLNDAINIYKDVKKFRTCNICGCKQYTTNFARHARTKNKKKKNKEAYYADEKFEIEKYEPRAKNKYRKSVV